MLVKLYDGTPHIANMPEAEAREAGYKLAVFTARPIASPGYHAASYWTEEAETCTQRWKIAEDDPFEPADTDKAEAYDILTGVSE